MTMRNESPTVAKSRAISSSESAMLRSAPSEAETVAQIPRLGDVGPSSEGSEAMPSLVSLVSDEENRTEGERYRRSVGVLRGGIRHWSIVVHRHDAAPRRLRAHWASPGRVGSRPLVCS